MNEENRRNSLSSIHSSDSSFIDGIFGDDVTDDDEEDDYVHDGEEKTRSIFTVANGYCLSHEERKSLDSRYSRDIKHYRYFGRHLSFRGKLRKFFLRNPNTRLSCNFIDLFIRLVLCLNYIIRVCLDDTSIYKCHGSPCDEVNSKEPKEINWYVILWVHRDLTVWILDIALTLICLLKTILLIGIARRGHRLEQVFTISFLLELFCDLPMIITIIYPILLKSLFVPVYLHCWLAARSLRKISNDLHLTKKRYQTISVTLLRQMLLLFVNITCLLFTTVCSIQHIQRGSLNEKNFSIFESLYFVVVTFTTVGYGDFSPDIWLGQLFMILTIALAFVLLPSQIQGILSTYLERVNAGGDYSQGFWNRTKHVIVCATTLTLDSLVDFLNEFYSNPKLENHHVILLCPHDLDSSKQVILKDPKWAHRVMYIKGSALKEVDLMRCQAQRAYACFFLAVRPTQNKIQADHHTILRSWAVKDYAPTCKQYVYLFHAANKIHLQFVDHVVCEDEISYALLANNCLYPGLSALVSLLVRSNSYHNKVSSNEPWQQIYGRHAGNEIYHIQLQKSIFFGQYVGSSFPQASADAHHRFGVALVAIIDSESSPPKLKLNPGLDYKLKGADFCFYMSVTKEQYTRIPRQALKNTSFKPRPIFKGEVSEKYLFKSGDNQHGLDTFTNLLELGSNKPEDKIETSLTISPDSSKTSGDTTVKSELVSKSEIYERCTSNSSTAPLLSSSTSKEEGQEEDVNLECDHSSHEQDTFTALTQAHSSEHGSILPMYDQLEPDKLTTGLPPMTLSSGYGKNICHVTRDTRPLCCLEWGKDCQHCKDKNANDPRWRNQLIILLAQHVSPGIFNFIIPLRSAFIEKNELSPIVLLLEEIPDALFLDTLVHFPLVYYMTGSIWNVDDLLLAGINQANRLVVVNRDPDSIYEGEEFMEDSATIVAVQKIVRLFPNVTVLTELSQTSNMRFMNFSSLHSSFKSFKQNVSQIFMPDSIFRLPFAAGHVFSTSMLDTLLYQTFTKGYLISFIRLLLGIDGEEGSGHLSSILIKKSTVRKFQVYGSLYEAMCRKTGEIPFAIYRTEPATSAGIFNAQSLFGSNLTQFLPNGKKFSQPKSTSLVKGSNKLHQRRLSALCQPRHVDISSMIQKRVKSLALSAQRDNESRSQPPSLSYVITNPSPGCELHVGDIVYVIQPFSLCASPSHSSKAFKYNIKKDWSPQPSESTPKMSRL